MLASAASLNERQAMGVKSERDALKQGVLVLDLLKQ
jgi:hypothetical protein